MKRIDRLEAKAKEKVKKKYGDSRDTDFSHLSDEELEMELKKLLKFHYEDELFDHVDWSDEQIYQKMDDDVMKIFEEDNHTENEIREFREALKSDWRLRPKKSDYTEILERNKEFKKYFKEKMARDNPGATIKCQEK